MINFYDLTVWIIFAKIILYIAVSFLTVKLMFCEENRKAWFSVSIGILLTPLNAILQLIQPSIAPVFDLTDVIQISQLLSVCLIGYGFYLLGRE